MLFIIHKWDAISVATNYGIPLPFTYPSLSTTTNFSAPLPLGWIDLYIDSCKALIVGVRTNIWDPMSTHYVFVTGKERNTYTILDPNNPNIKTLDYYGDPYYIVAYPLL